MLLVLDSLHEEYNFKSQSFVSACNSLYIFRLTATVIKAFERNDFFDQCITKARFFPTLHDAVLFAVEPDLLQESVTAEHSNALPEEIDDTHIDDQKV